MEEEVPVSARPRRRKINAGDIEREVAELAGFDANVLKERWLTLFGTEPPTGLSRAFLIRALAYRMQERVYGGLRPALLKFLAEAENHGLKQQSTKAFRSASVRAGTVLIREWRGVTHRVTALADGFEWQGRHYRSLSEVAREISGTRWSGPRFFGLRTRAEMSNG